MYTYGFEGPSTGDPTGPGTCPSTGDLGPAEERHYLEGILRSRAEKVCGDSEQGVRDSWAPHESIARRNPHRYRSACSRTPASRALSRKQRRRRVREQASAVAGRVVPRPDLS